MSDTPTYEIRTVLDFLTVPADRREACLRDFLKFLAVVGPSVALLQHVADASGVPGDAVTFVAVDLFRWMDDDREAMGMDVILPDGTRQSVFDITPDDANRIAASLDALNADSDPRTTRT